MNSLDESKQSSLKDKNYHKGRRLLSDGTRSLEAQQEPKLVGLTKEIQIMAPARRIFLALSTAEGLGKWWSYYTTGPNWDDDEVLLRWPRSGHHARIRFAEAKAPTFVEWSVIEHRPMKEWDGTAIRFSLEEGGSGETKLVLRHVGLMPECECYETCSDGWGYLVGQIKKLVEQGVT